MRELVVNDIWNRPHCSDIHKHIMVGIHSPFEVNDVNVVEISL